MTYSLSHRAATSQPTSKKGDTMNISKTTKTFAAKRNLDVTILDDVGEHDLLAIWEGDNDCEWMCSYIINNDGSFTWNGNIYLPRAIKEEIPATIRDEKHLREVLAFIGKEMAAA